ncbi:unnamed protein product [Pylaiella littoralis]
MLVCVGVSTSVFVCVWYFLHEYAAVFEGQRRSGEEVHLLSVSVARERLGCLTRDGSVFFLLSVAQPTIIEMIAKGWSRFSPCKSYVKESTEPQQCRGAR